MIKYIRKETKPTLWEERTRPEMTDFEPMNPIILTDDDGKEKADILLKNDTEEFIGKNGSVYCEINIPKNAMNGDYEGEIKICRQ